MTKKRIIRKVRNDNVSAIRNFEILNKFLKGVMSTKIKPAKLLIKNRG